MTASPVPADLTGAAPEPALEDPDAQKRRRRKAAILLLLLAALILLLLTAIWYLLFRQPITPPIPPIPPATVPSYATSIYGIDRPTGIAVTPAGDRIYVTDTGRERVVRIFDGGGNPIGTMVPPSLGGADHALVYAAIDPLTEEVYVSDRPTGSIYVFDRDGRYQREYRPTQAPPAWQPLGLVFDPGGNLFVTDLSGTNQRVLVFDRKGDLVRTFGEDSGLNFPNAIALDKLGNAYVTDSNNGRLLVFDPSGRQIALIGRGAGQGNLGLPRGVAIDDSDRVFVVDVSGQGVSVFRTLQGDDRRPEYLGFFGGEGITDGAFAFPNAAAVDDRGRVYVTDTANGRVQVWSY